MVWPSFTMAAGLLPTLPAVVAVKLINGSVPMTVLRAPVLKVSERCGLFKSA